MSDWMPRTEPRFGWGCGSKTYDTKRRTILLVFLHFWLMAPAFFVLSLMNHQPHNNPPRNHEAYNDRPPKYPRPIPNVWPRLIRLRFTFTGIAPTIRRSYLVSYIACPYMSHLQYASSARTLGVIFPSSDNGRQTKIIDENSDTGLC